MTPTKKHPDIDNLLTSLTGKDRQSTIIENKCVFCKNPNFDFRDDISRREYQISGMCVTCQDKVFGVDE